MKSVTISTFSLRVKTHKGKRVEYYRLDRLPLARKRSGAPAYKNLLDLLDEYFRRLKRTPAHDSTNLCILTASNIKRETRSVSAFLEKGEYGIQNDLMHIRRKAVTHQRMVEDAEMMPYYFLAAIPKESKRGLIGFQVEGETSIKGYFEQCFEDFLRHKCGECDLEIERVVPKRLMNQYLTSGRVSRLRFVHLKVPKEIEESYMLEDIANDATIELQVKAKRGSAYLLTSNIRSLLRRYKEGDDFVQIEGYEYDTLKVDVEVGGKSRTIDLAAPNKFRAGYNVTGKVVMKNGHPTYLSIDKVGREIVREIMHSLRLDPKGV